MSQTQDIRFEPQLDVVTSPDQIVGKPGTQKPNSSGANSAAS